MPADQPFTVLCQRAAAMRGGRADLHLHTTHSDGSYTPAQLVDLAKRTGMAAIAVTDHDTIGGVVPTHEAAPGSLEVIAGVELTAEYETREAHLLGYFFRLNDDPLLAALRRLRDNRVERFQAMIGRLRSAGIPLDGNSFLVGSPNATLGRRHLAMMLLQTGRVQTVREAFQRYLHDNSPIHVPKSRIPIAEAIGLIRNAGGVTSLAHPPTNLDFGGLKILRDLGLQAIEIDFPNVKKTRSAELRRWASQLGLGVTAGSDCHGSDGPGQAVGACTVTAEELAALRALSDAARSRR